MEAGDLPEHPEDPFPAPEAPPPARKPAAVDDDTEDFVDDENEEDDEATMDEEECLLDDDEDELGDLEAEADMDIEELRRKYGYGAPAPTDDDEDAGASAAADEEQEEEGEGGEEEEVEEPISAETLETAADSYFGVVAAGDGSVGGAGGGGAGEAEEDDGDYEPPEKKEFAIRVDAALYQAAVPESMEAGDRSAEHASGTLLWSPREDVTSEALNGFVHAWRARRAGVERDEARIDSRDDEDALFALLSSAYSADAAAAAYPFRAANAEQRTVEGDKEKMSEGEMAAFERGFKEHYKNFRAIRESFVPTRTLGELIDHYYHWKKTSRFNEFRRAPVRKDYMTEVMDHMEGKRKSAVAAAAAIAAAQPASASNTVIEAEEEQQGDEVVFDASLPQLPAEVWQQEQTAESA